VQLAVRRFRLTRAQISANLMAMSDRSKTSVWPRISALAVASFLFTRAVRGRSSANWLLLAVAGELFRFGVTGRSLFSQPDASAKQDDIVDLASELSFPASDPPAY